MPGLSSGMRSLSCSMCDLIPRSGIEPGLRAMGVGILATGAPGKSSLYFFSEIYFPPCHKNEESSLGNLKLGKQKRRRRRKGEKEAEEKKKREKVREITLMPHLRQKHC